MAVAKIDRKEQIQLTAQRLFREKGYAATSMRDLAKKVGVEPASLYSHFASKEDILKTICFRMANEFLEQIDALNDSVPNLTQRLERAIDAHIKVIVNDLDASAVFFSDWIHLSDEQLESFLEMREHYEQSFRSILEQGVLSGDFRVTDIDFTVRLLFATLNSTQQWYKASGTISPEQAGEQISDFILNGIAA